jgi:hypothetical protein
MTPPVKAQDYPLHLKEVQAHFGALMAAGWVAVFIILVAIFALADQLTRPGVTREIWPDDTPIAASDALLLDPEEQEEFDTALLGSAGRAPQHPLDHLPPIPPAGNAVLWQSAHEVSTRNEQLQQMGQCMARASCAPDEIETLGKSALQVIGSPAASGTGSCAYEPRVQDKDKRVPTGLLAIAMGWVPECRAAAQGMFQMFAEELTRNLAPEQVAAGELYARFQIAKLADNASIQDTRRFATDMTGVVQQVQSQPNLAKAYAELRDVPSLGLSMAEIRAESMWAQARLIAQQGTRAKLGRQMQMAGLFTPQISLLASSGHDSTVLNRGRSQLQLVWCALALRAGPDAKISEPSAGGSNICLATLMEQRVALPAALVCALTVRLSLRNGRWSPPECDSLDNPAADPRRFMRRMAASGAIWRETLKTYAALPPTSGKRAKLRIYLDSYAYISGNRLLWMEHEHRAALAGLALALLLPLGLAAAAAGAAAGAVTAHRV